MTLLTLAAALLPVAAPIDFNRDIRPILSENCFYCHGQDANKRKGDLRLDRRAEAVQSGAIVPGKKDESELSKRIRAHGDKKLMPPAGSNRKLSESQVELLERWIAEGAGYSEHWAFVTPVRPAPPKVRDNAWVRNPIDAFVLAHLESAGLHPSPEADRSTLIKRLSIDLTGLPPTPDEVRGFVNDRSPDAYAKLVERLLASPHYGERMALSWLDAARYADSNGFQQDGDTWQWIWRDWVVRAYNQDMPFDQFSTWQLAGDLLPNATNDQKVASGFNRNHMLNGEGGAIAEEQRFVNLFDRMDTTSTNWLALTMACAQCHDHKYDPITSRDYYRLMDAFNRVPERGTPQFFSSRIRVAPPLVELPTEENNKRIGEFESQIKAAESAVKQREDKAFEDWSAKAVADEKKRPELPEAVRKLLAVPEGQRKPADAAKLTSELRRHFDAKVRAGLVGKSPEAAKAEELRKQLAAYKADRIPRVMIMSDANPRETKILDRGEYLKGTEKVSFGTPEFLPPLPKHAPANRLGFAQWLFQPGHPLTARVQANRIWQHFFGQGIVKTAEDFGVQSEYPEHGQLLDWLAVEFRENGWSLKKLQRLIVTSATYRQSAKVTAEHRASDPENKLYSRSGRFRMPASVLRDWALAASGLANHAIGGAPVYPYQPDAVWEALAITKERDFTYPASKGDDLYRRSLYTFWRRTVGPANMFDSSTRQTCRVRASATSTPLHALTMLNDPTWLEASRALAQRVMKSSDKPESWLAEAFRRMVCREPSRLEMELLSRSLARQQAVFLADPAAAKAFLKSGESPRDESIPAERHAALAAVCLGILNLDEAMTRE
ncbi:MAG: DUF1553 domain-containing protein [Planctomycetes bacterium]|nr:DUF1553 domain-containing protein [Planctomycetota bacterium]